MPGADSPGAGLVRAVKKTIAQYQMAAPGEKILIGLSGGPDSVCLALVLMAMARQKPLTLGLAHLNHGLRGDEAARDEAFVREFAAIHALPLDVRHEDIRELARQAGIGLEAAGRQARYDFFKTLARTHGYTRIATGHTWDDHVEQVLMNLIRGAGPTGLRGIAPVRGHHIIRPLIQTPKHDILGYLDRSGQAYVLDASNQDPAFLRNRVRHRLIPFLEREFNPEIRTGLDRLSQIVRTEDDFMARLSAQTFDTARVQGKTAGEELMISGLAGCHPAVAARVLRLALGRVKQDLKRISHTHIQDVLDLACQGETGKSLDLPGQIRVYRLRDRIRIVREKIPLRALGQQQKKARTRPAAGPKAGPETGPGSGVTG